MTQFKPFTDSDGLSLTDTHGNELTVDNSIDKVSIYGQWQGSPDAPELKSLVDLLNTIKDSLASFKADASTKGIKVSKKKSEIALDLDINVTKDAQGLSFVLGMLAQLDKAKTNTPKP